MRIESIILLNDFCHAQGGASRVAIDEAIALRALGFKVSFLGAVGPVCEELLDGDVAVTCLDQAELADSARRPRAVLDAMWDRSAHRAMRAILAPLDPSRTIVHLHGYTKALSTAPAAAARRAGFSTICTLHDFFAACPNGAFFNYRSQQPCTLTALSPACLVTACDKRHPVHKIYRVVRGAIQRHVAGFPASVHHYIALSRRSSEMLRPYLPSGARLHSLPNIIGVDRAPPVDPGANQALMVVGRLDDEKGVVLAAAAADTARLPIVFVGDGPHRARLEMLGARVTGWLPAAQVRRELGKARCLVFPSLWYETFGLVVTEAAARGVPAIVSDISAPADRVIDGETGWLFRSGDLDDLVRRMETTRADSLVRVAGAAAYEAYWAAPANPRGHAKELLSIYAAVLADDRDAAQADKMFHACKNAAVSNPPQSTNLVPPDSSRARVMADAEPNHPTAEQ